MPSAHPSRPALPYALQVRVFRRDAWLCRWCHRPVVFAPALKFLAALAVERGHAGPLAFHDPRWRRDRAPLLDHLGAVVDHVVPFAAGGAHVESNFATACNKCNARKNDSPAHDHTRRSPPHAVKGKYGEPTHWDGLSSLFVVLAKSAERLTRSEKHWLVALTAV